jgi:hypothetical protein
MRTACFLPGRILVLLLFIGSYLGLSGCNDESKTSGTMVQVSEEDKAFLKSKRETYRGGPQKDKVKAGIKKKKS